MRPILLLTFTTTSPDDTLALGARIGRLLPPCAVIGLDGPLAAGKTWMAKGIVQGLGPIDTTMIKSPAYNLIHEYRLEASRGRVYHLDFYRLEHLSDADKHLFSEVLEDRPAISIVEWASKFLDQLVPGYLSIVLARSGTPSCRTIQIKAVGAGSNYEELLQRLAR